MYTKAGVILAGFEGANTAQLGIFEPQVRPRPQATALIQRLNQLNARYGPGSVQLAAAFTPKGQPPPTWQGQRQHRTRACTTSWGEV